MRLNELGLGELWSLKYGCRLNPSLGRGPLQAPTCLTHHRSPTHHQTFGAVFGFALSTLYSHMRFRTEYGPAGWGRRQFVTSAGRRILSLGFWPPCASGVNTTRHPTAVGSPFCCWFWRERQSDTFYPACMKQAKQSCFDS